MTHLNLFAIFSMQANADASKYLNSEVMKLQHAF